MELTLQDTISSKKKLIGMYLPIQIAVYVPSTKDANVPVSEDELNKRVDSVRKYLADMFGGFSSDAITGGYISTFKELIKEDIVKVIAFSTKEAYEENKQKLIVQISKWAKEWSQEAIGLEFENDLYYINQSESFKSGGKVEIKETSFLNGYEFSDYEDMINTLKRAKKEKYDLGDSTDTPNDFHKEILKAIKLSEDIKDEYKYSTRGDSVLVVKVKLYPDYDLDKAIESASSSKKLTNEQIDEIKEHYNDEFIYEEITQFIDMNRQDAEETLRDFIELNICKDEILFEGISGGYLIFQESDFFDEIVSDLEDNYSYKNFDNEGNFDSTEYDSYDEFLQKCGVDIRDYIGIIHYYDFAFGVFEAYVKNLINQMEKTGFQDYLIGEIEYYIDDNFKIKAKKVKKTKVKKEEMVDEYALGGKVTESSVESFLTNKVNFSKGNIAVNYSGDNGFLFHYGTLIAKIKGKSLTINEKYFSKTTSALSNLIERLAKDKGMVVSKAVFFDNGGNIVNWDEFKGGSDMVVNDSCVKLSVWLIKDIYPIEDWFILKSDNKLVIVFRKSLTDEEIENVREILSQFDECHYLLSFENLEKKDNGRSISIDLKYDNVSVGEFADGGGVGIVKGDNVIWNGNKYVLIKVENNLVGGLNDVKYHLLSTKKGVRDAVLDSLNDVKKYADGGGVERQSEMEQMRLSVKTKKLKRLQDELKKAQFNGNTKKIEQILKDIVEVEKYSNGGGVGEDNELKDRMVYISVSREILEGAERDSVVDFDYWKKLESAYPEETSGIGYKWEKQKEKELGGYSQFVQKYYQWEQEDGYPYEIAKKVYDKLNNFDTTRNGIAIIDLKTGKPILRQRWNEYRKSADSFVEKPDIINKYADGGSAMDLINKLKSKDHSVVQEALREIKKNNEPIQQVELKKINIPIDYKSAISDLIDYYGKKSEFRNTKYAKLNQEEAEYLYDVFKNYEELPKNEDGNYVAKVKFAYDGSNFKETEEQDSKLESFLEGIDEKGFIYYDSYDSIIEAYQITIDFINSVRGRLETRKNVSMGLDLFPETSKIQEANPKYNDILSKKIVLKTLIFQYIKQKDSSIKEKLWDKIQFLKNEIKDMENHEYKDGGDVKSKSSMLKKLHALNKHKHKSEELLKKYENMNSELKSKKGSSYEDILKGGKSDGMDEAELAKKHGVSVAQIKKQIEKGISIEKEHTDNLAIQMEIAKDHIEEFVDYYDRLEKMEKQAKIKNTIKTNKSLSNSQVKSIGNYLKKKGLDSSDFDVSNSGIVLIYKDLSDKVNKEISLFIKNSVI